MDNTIQKSLKELFYSLGGNADAVRNTEDGTAIIDAMSALGLGAKIEEGGGGSGVLVAHATVDALPEPDGEPVTITVDKTVEELAAAETSIVEISFDESGAECSVQLPFNFVMNADGVVQLAYASGIATLQLLSCELMVSGMNMGGNDTFVLIAKSASSGGGPLCIGVTVTESGNDVVYTMDKTWEEINTAMVAKTPTFVYLSGEGEAMQGFVLRTASADHSVAVLLGEALEFTASSADGYPSFTEQGE